MIMNICIEQWVEWEFRIQRHGFHKLIAEAITNIWMGKARALGSVCGNRALSMCTLMDMNL